MTDTNTDENHVDRPDQAEKNPDKASSEVRTDGGEVATEPVQTSSASTRPAEAEAPKHPIVRESQKTDRNTTPLTDSETTQSETPPTNGPEGATDSESPETSDENELFSGVVLLDDVLDFYHETNPWGAQPSTVKSYKTRLRYFRQFCTERDIEDLNDIQPSHMDEFHNFLREQPQLGARSSVKSCLASLRKFLRYCERRKVFDRGFHELVILPTLSENDGSDETWLPRDDAKEIVAYLAKFEPFTREHVVWALLAETGIRQSTLYAFDLDDYDATERYIEAVNREATGTRLKNGAAAEREISISNEAGEVLDGYVQANRTDVTDEHDRQPLITTRSGRLQKSTIRQYVYAWSRPCATGSACPVDEDPDTCPAAQTNNAAYDCPESVSPHPIRRGYITHLRANGVPTGDVISKRCDANPETIERWYDMTMESERREARRSYVEDL